MLCCGSLTPLDTYPSCCSSAWMADQTYVGKYQCRSPTNLIQADSSALTLAHQAYTRVIQKMSSVCEYCCCNAAVTMVQMRAEFVDSVARHGRNLQTFERCLCIMLCAYNV